MTVGELTIGQKVFSKTGRGEGVVVSIDPDTKEVRIHFHHETFNFLPHTAVFRACEVPIELE